MIDELARAESAPPEPWPLDIPKLALIGRDYRSYEGLARCDFVPLDLSRPEARDWTIAMTEISS